MRVKLMRLLPALLMVLMGATWGGAAEKADNPRVTIDLAGHPVKGPASAPVSMVVFSDYL